MRFRICIWAISGFLVAVGWAIYALVSRPFTFSDPLMALAQLTCPIALFRSYPLRLEWVVLANAATYALVGLLVESLRRRLVHAR
jgi:hypothetical protein